MSLGYFLRLEGFETTPKAAVGDRVRHGGTKIWGVVLEVVPQRDGTDELKVQRDKPLFTGGENEPTWWGSYHVDSLERKGEKKDV